VVPIRKVICVCCAGRITRYEEKFSLEEIGGVSKKQKHDGRAC
jgi:hypothetical protein